MADDLSQPTSAVEVHEHLAIRNDSWSKILIGVAALAFLAGVALAVIGYRDSHTNAVWRPLGPYRSPQQVTNGPTIRVTDTVNVTATKCARETVTARGSKYWQRTDVRGTVIYDGYGVGPHPKGCQTLTFRNHILPEIRAIVEHEGKPSSWVIEGTDTPIELSTGRQGQPLTWQTEQFLLVP